MQWRVRPVRERDLGELHRLETSVFGEGAYPYFAFRQFFDALGDGFFTEANGRGYVLLSLQGEHVWVLSLAVSLECRGQGLGRALLERAFEAARGRDIRLHVSPDNPALRLYESLGFERLKFVEDCFGDGSDRWVLERSRGAGR